MVISRLCKEHELISNREQTILQSQGWLVDALMMSAAYSRLLWSDRLRPLCHGSHQRKHASKSASGALWLFRCMKREA